MYVDHSQLSQFSQFATDGNLTPLVFRALFVLFLGMVMVWMKDDDRKETKNV